MGDAICQRNAKYQTKLLDEVHHAMPKPNHPPLFSITIIVIALLTLFDLKKNHWIECADRLPA